MMTSCKNCGGHFTDTEMAQRQPPMHPWRLTPVGERVLGENLTNGGDVRKCPNCGCQTLAVAVVPRA